jgi:deoxyadenosine/deoxycytidine kinase
MPRPIIISIEGNIGSGKSTILSHLKEFLKDNHRISFLKEPVDVWETIKDSSTGENILEKFYQNQKKYGFSFQVMAYATRLATLRNEIRKVNACDIIICERSLEADKNIFAQMLFDDGMIDELDFQIYNHFYTQTTGYEVDAIVYLDTEPEKSHERVTKRSRDGESSISLEYLTRCKSYHDNWLNNTETCVLKLDANPDVYYNLEDELDVGRNWLTKIKRFIDELVKERQDYEEWKRR